MYTSKYRLGMVGCTPLAIHSTLEGTLGGCGWNLDPLPSGAVRRPFLSRVSCSGMFSWASMA